MKLIDEYMAALENCESNLIERSKERRFSGMEGVYHTALMEVLENNEKFNRICSEVPLEEIDGTGHGFVDIVIERENSDVHAIELKVVQLPREGHLGPNGALYDIGQITSDFLRLKGANKLTSFDCVIVLHGVLLCLYNTRKKLLREFHNRMFVDFKTSETYGELKSQKNVPFRKKQKRLIQQLGLDQPFTPPTGSMCARTSGKLGLIAIHGPLP